MLKKSICCAVILCIGLFGIFTVGCNGEKLDDRVKPQNCEAVLETTVYGWRESPDDRMDFIEICTSLDTLKEVCLRNGYDFFDSEDQIYNEYNTDAGEIIREYTDEYFQDKSLVICAFYRSSHSGQYRIKEVEVNAGLLTMYIQSPYSNVAECVINNVFLVAGVEKSFVAGVTNSTFVYD